MNRDQWLATLPPEDRAKIEGIAASLLADARKFKREWQAAGYNADQRRRRLRVWVDLMCEDLMTKHGITMKEALKAMAQWNVVDRKGQLMPEFGGEPKKPSGR